VSRTHGMSGTRVHRVWKAMLDRCRREKCAAYKNYGGRGIAVCERWMTFDNFFADMGHPPEGMQIDRIDNDGNYEPENCRWATRIENARNKRWTSKVSINGSERIVQDCATEVGIQAKTIKARIHRCGWDHNRAINEPVHRRLIEIDGERKTLTDWCRQHGVSYSTVFYRLLKGMSPLEALVTPSFQGRKSP